MITYILRTRNHPHRLHQTLGVLARLLREDAHAEVIVADDCSEQQVLRVAGWPAHVRLGVSVSPRREGWASVRRAAAMADAMSTWTVVLGEGVVPVQADLGDALRSLDKQALVAGGELVTIARRGHSQRVHGWSLPEVTPTRAFAVRTGLLGVLGALGGELAGPAVTADLCARAMVEGGRVAFEPRFACVAPLARRGVVDRARQVRDLCRVLGAAGVARADVVRAAMDMVSGVARRRIARRIAIRGMGERHGGAAAVSTCSALGARLLGLEAARSALGAEYARGAFTRVGIIDEGLHCWCVARALRELGAQVVDMSVRPGQVAIGTLSPGAVLDAWFERTAWGAGRLGGARVLAPWSPVAAKTADARTEPAAVPADAGVVNVMRPAPAAA